MKESIYDKMTSAEREVSNFLKEIGIEWKYEQPIFIWDDGKRPRVWTPDFYLTQFGIYVEVCGSKDFDYEYRKKIFSKNGHEVIFLHVYKDKSQWVFHLIRYIKKILNERYQEFNQILIQED